MTFAEKLAELQAKQADGRCRSLPDFLDLLASLVVSGKHASNDAYAVRRCREWAKLLREACEE